MWIDEKRASRGVTMKNIKGLIKEVLAGEGLERVEDLVAIKEAWRRIEGLPKGVPCALKGGKLVVRVDTHPWAQELSLRRKEILDKLRDEAGLQIDDVIVKYKPKV